MLKALLYKELRETAWIAALALLAYLGFAANCAGYRAMPIFGVLRTSTTIPFIQGEFTQLFGMVSFCFVIALAMRQTATESGRGTWLFLLHRPVSVRVLLAVKIAVGLGLYLLCGAVAILAFAAWAATPGQHASPFQWWMTSLTWEIWTLFALFYIGAFLAGMRPGRWFGTRLFPLVAGGMLAILIAPVPHWWLWGMPLTVLSCACLVCLIGYVARTRDYS